MPTLRGSSLYACCLEAETAGLAFRVFLARPPEALRYKAESEREAVRIEAGFRRNFKMLPAYHTKFGAVRGW